MEQINRTVVGISIHRYRDLLGVTHTITCNGGGIVSLGTIYIPQQFAEFLVDMLRKGIHDLKNVQFLDSEFRTQRIGQTS